MLCLKQAVYFILFTLLQDVESSDIPVEEDNRGE